MAQLFAVREIADCFVSQQAAEIRARHHAAGQDNCAVDGGIQAGQRGITDAVDNLLQRGNVGRKRHRQGSEEAHRVDTRAGNSLKRIGDKVNGGGLAAAGERRDFRRHQEHRAQVGHIRDVRGIIRPGGERIQQTINQLLGVLTIEGKLPDFTGDAAAAFQGKIQHGCAAQRGLRRNAARLPLCEILREGTGEGYCWYDMTYSGSAVGLFRYIHSNPPGKSAAILRSVLRALDEQLYRPTARPADPEKIEEYLNKKMDANLEKIRDARILKELWNYDRIWINGRSYRNLKELGRLFDHNALRTLFAADPVADIHGDLTVENIICRTDVENPDKAWYIIDPNTGNLHDSPYLDYGKLLQSLHGGYEFMMMTPRCTVQENHIDFQLTRSAAYDTLFEAVCDDLRARCGAAGLHSILAHELIHWLRLMPYKLNKDKKRAPMFYAGLVMVANDLNTWENEGKFDEKARTDRR